MATRLSRNFLLHLPFRPLEIHTYRCSRYIHFISNFVLCQPMRHVKQPTCQFPFRHHGHTIDQAPPLLFRQRFNLRQQLPPTVNIPPLGPFAATWASTASHPVQRIAHVGKHAGHGFSFFCLVGIGPIQRLPVPFEIPNSRRVLLNQLFSPVSHSLTPMVSDV